MIWQEKKKKLVLNIYEGQSRRGEDELDIEILKGKISDKQTGQSRQDRGKGKGRESRVLCSLKLFTIKKKKHSKLAQF